MCSNKASNQIGVNLPDKLGRQQTGEIYRGQALEFCPEEWRPWKGKCYFVSKEKKDWISSLRDCVSRDSHLALLKNTTDLGFISNSTKEQYWIGLNFTNNTWIWLDGTKSRAPEIRHNSSCAVISANRLLDWNCDYTNRWICEKVAVQLHFDPEHNLPVTMTNGRKHTVIINDKVQP
uniref:Killer cell lectin-like receptor subfamily F member 2 n=1 Tax=Geotrypetes seraphini TaxID=260995 RepID=A0A6P8SQ25_GEOSA|nr:killer cell lectin-like receptor subfamily F member 2 [Geotrypetes seraphini]